MERCIKLYLITTCILRCNCVSLRRQLQHIAKTKLESSGLLNHFPPQRRFYQYDPRELSKILGVPDEAAHLPEAEAILPAHTLLRPALGMLKSSVKFPHKEMEDGFGVYGHFDTLGLRYNGKNERLMYSGFRRFPAEYIMVVPSKSQDSYEKPRFKLEPVVINLDRKTDAKSKILKIFQKLNIPVLKGKLKVFVTPIDGNMIKNDRSPKQIIMSHYINDEKPPNLNGNNFDFNKVILRGGNKEKLNFIDYENSSQEKPRTEFPKILEKKKEVTISKKDWFKNTKNAYNHIVINQNAPDLNELAPPIMDYEDDNKLRNWWFFSADDYKPFTETE